MTIYTESQKGRKNGNGAYSMSNRTPLTELERGIVAKLAKASFPPATASKRFAHDLADGYVKELSSRGRRFLAFVVNRFRRQYFLTEEETRWVAEWLHWQEEVKPDPVQESFPGIVEPEVKQMEMFQ